MRIYFVALLALYFTGFASSQTGSNANANDLIDRVLNNGGSPKDTNAGPGSPKVPVNPAGVPPATDTKSPTPPPPTVPGGTDPNAKTPPPPPTDSKMPSPASSAKNSATPASTTVSTPAPPSGSGTDPGKIVVTSPTSSVPVYLPNSSTYNAPQKVLSMAIFALFYIFML
ncbi:hypothetical protein MP638_004104 [Amoeboaphelidium occidentale]|nr:hypothetical protein MP638_004104 [Amoeboaphelidium occidentale]